MLLIIGLTLLALVPPPAAFGATSNAVIVPKKVKPAVCTTQSQTNIDLQIARLIGLGKDGIGRNFPTNEKELRIFCKESHVIVVKVQTYINKCFDENVLNLAKLIFYAIKGVERRFCRGKALSKSRKLRTLVANAPCMNKYARKNTTCMDNFMHKVQTIALWPHEYDRQKFHYTCCEYFKTMECADAFLSSKPCMRKAKDIILDFFKSFTQGLIDVSCGEYTDQTDKCSTLPPPPALPANVKPPTKYHTMVFPLIDLLLSIKSED